MARKNRNDLKDLTESWNEFNITTEESDLKNYYEDRYITRQQHERDKQVTSLLKQYVKAYKNKVFASKICRWVILSSCLLVILGFSAALAWLVIFSASAERSLDWAGLAAFVTACISFASLIIGLLTVVTKYFFPENDEQYITKIVEVIQKNDLENKRENAKNPLPAQESPKR